MRREILVAAVMVCGSSCGGYRKDLETVCDARARAKIPADADDDARDAALSGYMLGHVYTPEAKKLFSRFGSLSTVAKAKILRTEAAKEGIAPCLLADEFDPPAK
jgi:hypothetical protein